MSFSFVRIFDLVSVSFSNQNKYPLIGLLDLAQMLHDSAVSYINVATSAIGLKNDRYRVYNSLAFCEM